MMTLGMSDVVKSILILYAYAVCTVIEILAAVSVPPVMQ